MTFTVNVFCKNAGNSIIFIIFYTQNLLFIDADSYEILFSS